MARPKANELTQRELEVMHVFWRHGDLTAQQARDRLEEEGRPLAYTTVATLIRILVEKRFLRQTNEHRPFVFQAVRSFEEVSSRLVSDLMRRVFGGSREMLLTCLMDQKKLTPKERSLLEQLLEDRKR